MAMPSSPISSAPTPPSTSSTTDLRCSVNTASPPALITRSLAARAGGQARFSGAAGGELTGAKLVVDVRVAELRVLAAVDRRVLEDVARAPLIEGGAVGQLRAEAVEGGEAAAADIDVVE